MGRSLPSRLLGVWAHPDDECYLSAGLMARVIEAGGHVRLVCATRGELGTDDPELAGSDRFARLRQAELEASLAQLGVTDVHVLDLGDGACASADHDRMAAIVEAHIVEHAPDTIVTFGPDGITGHADHLAVCRWTTAAAASQPDATLLYATMTHDHVERHRELHDSLGLFAGLDGGRPCSVPQDEIALQCSLDRAELIVKRAALACHHSQTAALAEFAGEERYFWWWRNECFRPPTPNEWAAVADRQRSSVAMAGGRHVVA